MPEQSHSYLPHLATAEGTVMLAVFVILTWTWLMVDVRSTLGIFLFLFILYLMEGNSTYISRSIPNKFR